MSQQPSGWYDDPANPDNIRYWDGVAWTNHTSAKRTPAPPQAPAGDSGTGQTQQMPQSGQTTAVPSAPAGGPPAWGDGAWGSGSQGQSQGSSRSSAPGVPTAPPATASNPGWAGQQSAPAGDWMHAMATTPDGVALASYGRRLGAWLIDAIILSVIGTFLVNTFVPSYGVALERFMQQLEAVDLENQAAVQDVISQAVEEISGPVASVSLLMVAFISLYCIVFWCTIGRTPGKLVTGIAVRRIDRPGPLDIVTALRRRILPILTLVPFIGLVASIAYLVSLLWPLWDSKRQGLHDKMAGTQVVMASPRRER